MYYLDEVDVKKVNLLLRESRDFNIDERLRGYNFYEEPIKPYNSIKLAAWEFASYCPTYRDVFLRRKLGITVELNINQVKGFAIHQLISFIFSNARKLILLKEDLGKLQLLCKDKVEGLVKKFKLQEFEEKLNSIVKFETSRIKSKVEQIKSKYKFINENSLSLLAIPFFTEILLDGSLVGLSENLKVDSSNIFNNMLFDLKYGRERERNRLQLAAYAVAYESIFERPIDVGCIVYVNFNREELKICRDIFVIDDTLRSKFLNLRDELQMRLEKDMIPEIAKGKECNSCLYRESCFGIK